MTPGKAIALARWAFVGKVMFLLLNMLSRLVITFFPRSKRLLISFLSTFIIFQMYTELNKREAYRESPTSAEMRDTG